MRRDGQASGGDRLKIGPMNQLVGSRTRLWAESGQKGLPGGGVRGGALRQSGKVQHSLAPGQPTALGGERVRAGWPWLNQEIEARKAGVGMCYSRRMGSEKRSTLLWRKGPQSPLPTSFHFCLQTFPFSNFTDDSDVIRRGDVDGSRVHSQAFQMTEYQSGPHMRGRERLNTPSPTCAVSCLPESLSQLS